MSIWGDLEGAGIHTNGTTVSIPGLEMAIGAGKVLWVDAANGSAARTGRSPKDANSSIVTALGKVTDLKNDKINLIASGSSDNLAASLAFSKNLTHVRGIGSYGRINQRSRIGHSANFSPLIALSGYGNSFADLYISHGRGNAANLILMDCTGPRNSFHRVHFAGPMHATEGATAGYRLMRFNADASEYLFNECTFGIDTVQTAASIALLEFLAGACGRFFFKDCTFIINAKAGAAGATFMKFAAGVGAGYCDFRGCKFLNIGGTAMTLGIDGTGLGNFKLYFDYNSGFSNVTNVCTAGTKANVLFQTAAGLYGAPA